MTTRTVLFDGDGKPLIIAAQETGRTVEVVRSFSYKVNLANHGGPQYESIDLFASQKVSCDESQAADASEAVYQFCRAEVLRAAKEVIAAQRRGRNAA